jgi:TonB family protein
MAAPRRSTLESPSPTVSSVSPNYSTYQVGSSVNDSQKLETETESATTKILKKRLQNYANILWDRAKKGIISEEVAEEIWQLRWAQEVLVLENETLLLENEKLRSQLVQLQKKEYQPDTVSTKINKDAERTSNPAPELTAEMKKRSFNANLRIRVTVNPDGSHEEELIQGSGDSEIDALVLKTMRRWKWQPALRDGEKVTNSQVFRYTISIND